MADKTKKKKTRDELIEASLKNNRTTVKIKALKDKHMKEGAYYWVSEDAARSFVENGKAKIEDKDYEARLLKSGREMPKAKRKPKAKVEPVAE